MMRRLLPATFAAALLMVGCADAFGPDGDRVRVTFQPRFQEHDGEASENPALRVDNVRVTVLNEAGDTVVDRVVMWPLDQDTLRLDVILEVSGTETFSFGLQGREGDVVLFETGDQPLDLSAGGEGTGTLLQPVLEYAGPEAGLVAVEVSGAPEYLSAGGSTTLTAVGTDEAGGDVSDPLVAWSSLDPDIATVDGDGVVTAGSAVDVTARIVARVAFRTLVDTVEIPIQPAAVVAAPDRDTINALGFTTDLSFYALTTDGDTAGVIDGSWTSDDPGVVRIKSASGQTATVTGVSVGSTWVRVAAGIRTDSVLITVRQVVRSVAVVPGDGVLSTSDTVALTALAVDSGGSVIPGGSYTWTASGGAVSVDATGVARALATGAGTVSVTRGGVTGNASLAVSGSGGSAVAVGDHHRCMLDPTGAASCWGENEFGQLGDGTTIDRAEPTPVSGGLTFTSIAAGGNFTCGIVSGGTTYCWGGNTYGQLGDGTATDSDTPVTVAGVSLAAVVAGGRHACGLDAAGAAYCWGLDEYGQLGDGGGGLGASPVPVAVSGGLTFSSIAAGGLHTCALDTGGTPYCWGRGVEGQVGDGAMADTTLPSVVAGGHTFTALATGAGHSCGLDGTGAAYCWGYNSSGQLGDGTLDIAPQPAAVQGSLQFTEIALGWVHTCALTAAGDPYCWGSNAALELGQGGPRASSVPVPAPVESLASVRAGGRRSCGVVGSVLVCWGGIPPEDLGRQTLIIPDPAGPPAETSASR